MTDSADELPTPSFQLPRPWSLLGVGNWKLGVELFAFEQALGVRVRRAGEQPFAVLERDAAGVGGVRSVARLPALNDQDRARRQIFLSPSAPEQAVRCAGLERPAFGLPVVVDVEVDPRVGIGPAHLHDFAGQLDRLVLVEFRRERMMSDGWRRGEHECRSSNNAQDLSAHEFSLLCIPSCLLYTSDA